VKQYIDAERVNKDITDLNLKIVHALTLLQVSETVMRVAFTQNDRLGGNNSQHGICYQRYPL
jgi:hypothetical protein